MPVNSDNIFICSGLFGLMPYLIQLFAVVSVTLHFIAISWIKSRLGNVGSGRLL